MKIKTIAKLQSMNQFMCEWATVCEWAISNSNKISIRTKKKFEEKKILFRIPVRMVEENDEERSSF